MLKSLAIISRHQLWSHSTVSSSGLLPKMLFSPSLECYVGMYTPYEFFYTTKQVFRKANVNGGQIICRKCFFQ